MFQVAKESNLRVHNYLCLINKWRDLVPLEVVGVLKFILFILYYIKTR